MKSNEWDGEGIPPIGTVCEYYWSEGYAWRKCEIVAYYFAAVVAVDVLDGAAVSLHAGLGLFRPIKTPEQITTEERPHAKSTQRKVRKDFDKSKEYSVNVEGCTEEEKGAVQQAFFDVGFQWGSRGEVYQYLNAVKYSNTTNGGMVAAHLLYCNMTTGCNMTPEEFLNLVYEPEKIGHVHAENMALYAEDARTHDEPWKLWQVKCDDGSWGIIYRNPTWYSSREYRRKPNTKLIHGVEVPAFEFTPEVGEEYYIASVNLPGLYGRGRKSSKHCAFTQLMIERGLLYPFTEEGAQAAILHSKAILGEVL